MHVKRFTAPDMAKAMRMVRQELGPDAVILSTGKLPDGGVEISAAVDKNPTAPAEQPEQSCAPDRLRQSKDRDLDQRGQADHRHNGPDQGSDPNLEGLVNRVECLNKALAEHLMRSEAAKLFFGPSGDNTHISAL